MERKFYDFTRETKSSIQGEERIKVHKSRFGNILAVEHFDDKTDTGFNLNTCCWHAFDIQGRMSAVGETSRNALIWELQRFGITEWI